MPSPKPSFADAVQALKKQPLENLQLKQAQNPRLAWIYEAQMVMQLNLTMKNDRSLYEKILVELQKRGVPLEFLDQVLANAEKEASSLAMIIALKVAEVMENFFTGIAREALQNQNNNPAQENRLTPAFATQFDWLAENLKTQNNLFQQEQAIENLNTFDQKETGEVAVENAQQNEFNKYTQQQLTDSNAPENQATQQNSEKKFNPQPTLIVVKHALELEALVKLAPKLAEGLAKEAVKLATEVAQRITPAGG